MTLKIIHKNNTSAGQAPASGDLDIGEIAVNSADAQLYTKDNDGAVQSFTNDNDAVTVQQFTQAGSSAVQRTVESKLQDVVSVLDFIPEGTDTAAVDCTTWIQSALNASTAVVFPKSVYLISSSLSVPSGTVVYGNWSTLKPSSDHAVLEAEQDSQVNKIKVDITALPSYSENVVTLSPTKNVRGPQFIQPWINGLTVEFGGSTGTAVKFDASAYYIQETTLDNIVVYLGNTAVAMAAGAQKWCNGNFVKLTAHDSVYSIFESTAAGSVAGNVYELIAENNSNNCEVYLNRSATVTGALWDRAVLTFKGDHNRVFSGTALVNDNLTDEGKFNSIHGKDVEYYYNKRSIQLYSDRRNNLRALRGYGEYVEDFMNGTLSGGGVVTSVGSGSTSYQAKTYGGATNKWAGVRFVMNTGTSTNNSQDLRWPDSGLLTGHDPVYLSTALLSETTNVSYQFGFYRDANNYIIYDVDSVDPAAPTITPKVKNSGTETIGTPIDITLGRIFWFRIVVSNEKCIFSFSSANVGSQDVGEGIYNLGNEETITTNIPTSSVLQPRNYVKTLTTSQKTLSMLYLQVNWCNGYQVP